MAASPAHVTATVPAQQAEGLRSWDSLTARTRRGWIPLLAWTLGIWAYPGVRFASPAWAQFGWLVGLAGLAAIPVLTSNAAAHTAANAAEDPQTLLNVPLALEHGDQAGAARFLAETVCSNNSATLTAHPHEAWPLVVLAASVPRVPADLVALAESLRTRCAPDAAHRAVLIAHTTATAARWDDQPVRWHTLGQLYDEAQGRLAAAQAHAAERSRAAGVHVSRILREPLGRATRIRPGTALR